MLRRGRASVCESASARRSAPSTVCLYGETSARLGRQRGRDTRRELTVAIPLGHKFVFEEGRKVPGEERVHVDPYTAIRPHDQQPNEVPVYPRLLVVHFQQASPFEWRSPRQHLDICHTQLECVWEPIAVVPEDGVNAEVPIGPHDQTGISNVLSRKKGFEHVFLSFAKRCEVDTPVRMVVDTVVGGYERGVV